MCSRLDRQKLTIFAFETLKYRFSCTIGWGISIESQINSIEGF